MVFTFENNVLLSLTRVVWDKYSYQSHDLLAAKLIIYGLETPLWLGVGWGGISQDSCKLLRRRAFHKKLVTFGREILLQFCPSYMFVGILDTSLAHGQKFFWKIRKGQF